MRKELPVRIHPRLKCHDYNNNGAYFITFCVKDKHETLGQVVGRDAPGAPFVVALSEYGKITQNEIENTPLHYNNIVVENFVVMPNHVHMIALINGGNGAPRASRPTTALIPNFIGIIKKKTNKAFGFNMWQRSYHDHIIRDEQEYQRIWQYIDENPAKWHDDRYYIEH